MQPIFLHTQARVRYRVAFNVSFSVEILTGGDGADGVGVGAEISKAPCVEQQQE